MSDTGRNNGKRIGEIVRSALQSGDLSRLKDLGPAVEDTVNDVMKEIPGVQVQVRTGKQPPQPAQPQPPQPNAAAPWRGYVAPAGPRQKKGAPAGVVQVVLGVLGLVAFGLGTLVSLAAGMLSPLGGGMLLGLAGGLGVVAAASGAVMAAGLSKNKLAARAGQYKMLFEAKTVYTFEELAAHMGKEPKQIKKELRRLHAKGLLPQVRMDAAETCVMQGDEAWQLYLESEKAREEKEREQEERSRRLADPSTAAMERFAAEGAETLAKIRAANKSLPGEEISQRLQRLEEMCERIFGYVQQHPEKLPDTRQFMDYYLPTTLKLVEKYQQYEGLGYQPENVKQAKAEIERTLDTIHVAFGNLLESLYQHDTLDVSTDIEVLKQKLEQEGLTGRQFEITPSDKGQ